MKKRILKIMAFILPVIILIPCMVVFSEDPLPSELYIGSEEVIYNGTVTNISSGTGWRYEKDTNTLYLTNATIDGVDGVENGLNTYKSYGIYADGDLNIKISGENNVSASAPDVQRSAAAIIVTGKLTLSADDSNATLNINTADGTSLTMNAENTGIRALGGFNISGGTINIKVGAAQGCNVIGIEAWADSYISGSATLNIESGNGTNHSSLYSSTGIDMSGNPGYNLYVSGGASVTSSSGTSDNEANGINVANLYVSDNASVTGISVEGTRKSYGIQGSVIMSGSAHVIGVSKDAKTGISGGVDLTQATEGYYWRTSETVDFTKSGTQTYRRGNNAYVELKLHEHEFSSTYNKYDDDEHWKSCTTDCPIDAKIETDTHSHSETTGECSCGHSIPFTIAIQPDNLSVEYAYKTEPPLSVKVNTFGSESVSYQWYEGNNTETGTILTGATQSTYNVPTGKTTGEYSYYCVVTAGSYTETSTTATLTIERKNISGGTLEIKESYTYTGQTIIPEHKVVVDGVELIETTDYTISYKMSNQTATPRNVGEYTLVITGANGYVGELTEIFNITQATPVIGEVYVTNAEVTDKNTAKDVILASKNPEINVPGELTLDETSLLANKTTYGWTFTPSDETNYKKVTGTIEIDVKDTTLPTAEIKIGDKVWNEFKYQEALAHELFTKENIEVTINAEDNLNGSRIKKVEYYLSKGVVYENAELIESWNTLDKVDGKYTLTIKDNMNVHIYVKVTDNDGNSIVINTSGIVKYADITETTKTIEYTKTLTEDVNVEIDLKENTVNSIKYGEVILTDGKEYVVSNEGIVFDAQYLNSFAAGEYEFIISYNPQGVTTDKVNLSTTTVTLTVVKATPEYTIPTNLTGIYGSKLESVNLPLGFAWDNKEEVLSAVGEKVYKVTYTPEDTDSYEIIKDIEVKVNVLPKSIENAKVTLGSSLTYNGSEQTQTISSVTLDEEDVTYNVIGNKATKVGIYTLTIEGTGNFSGTMEITYKVLPNTSILDNLTKDNVTIEDKEVIEDLKQSINDSNLTEEEKNELQNVIDKCDDLLDKIENLEKIEEEMEEIDKTLDDLNKDDITKEDKEEIQETIDKIDELIKNEDVTDEQKKELEEEKNKSEELLDKIEELEKIEEEMEEIDKTLDDLNKDDITKEDKEEIQETIDKIDELIKNEDVTDDQKKELEEDKKEAEDLLDKIEKLEQEENNNNNSSDNNNSDNNNNDSDNNNNSSNSGGSNNVGNQNSNNQKPGSDEDDNDEEDTSVEEIIEELDKFDEETIKVSDKETIEEIIIIIDKIIGENNITEEEREELEQRKEEANKLLDKISKIENGDSDSNTKDDDSDTVDADNNSAEKSLTGMIWLGILAVIAVIILIWRAVSKKNLQNS